MVAINIAGRRYASLRLGLSGWREIARYGTDMLASTGVMQVYMRLSDFMVGWLLGLHALGLYARAAGLLAMMWENFQLIILRVVYVDLVAQKRMGLSFRPSYLRVLSVATGFLWPAFGGVAVEHRHRVHQAPGGQAELLFHLVPGCGLALLQEVGPAQLHGLGGRRPAHHHHAAQVGQAVP